MSSTRPAWRLRIIRRSGVRSRLGIDYSQQRVYRLAQHWVPSPDDPELDPVVAIDVLHREPGSETWGLFDAFWRHDRDGPTGREVRQGDGEATAAPPPPTS